MSAPPELFDQAFALHQQGRFEEALEGYQQLLRHDPRTLMLCTCRV
jgi:tetratricopeptide (TPR) repeat protein